MGKIIAWECDHTGQLFKEEADYLTHTRKVMRQLALEERARRQREEEVARMQPMYQRSTFRALEKWILDNSKLILKFGRSYGRERKNGNLVAVHFYDMTYGEQSCSHSAPLGKKTNWCGKDNGPRTFPGWHGQIQLWFDADHHGWEMTDALKAVGVCTGGGGSCSDSGRTKQHPKGYCVRYEVTLWDEDFPKLIPAGADLLPGTAHSGNERTIASIVHDIYHYDRGTVRHRVSHFQRMVDNMERLRKWAPGQMLTKYCPLWDNDRSERLINFAARAYARDYPYYVDGRLDRKLVERLRFQIERRDVEVRMIGGLNDLPLICVDPEPFVGWKIGGELSPTSRIIDLNKRLERLGAKRA